MRLRLCATNASPRVTFLIRNAVRLGAEAIVASQFFRLHLFRWHSLLPHPLVALSDPRFPLISLITYFSSLSLPPALLALPQLLLPVSPQHNMRVALTLAILATMIAVGMARTGTCSCFACSSSIVCSDFSNGCSALGGFASCATTAATCSDVNCLGDDGTDCAASCATFSCSGSSWVCSKEKKDVCFPSAATVQLENGKKVTMDKIKLGDRVLVAPDEYSEVYLFTHQLPEATAEVVKLTTLNGEQLRLTPNHYIYIDGKLAAAHTVKPGDAVTLGNGTQVPVATVGREMANGLFNPHTLHGDVVVDGITTSTYTQGIAPGLAHAALWPVRALYQAGINVADDKFASGSPTLAGLLPDGRDRY